MSKDSQMDSNEVRRKKAKGNTPINDDAADGEGRNNKKQSGSRHKPNSMK